MSIIIAPDSFKGSLSAEEFCRIAAAVCREKAPAEPVICLPLADGGEGTLDCILAAVGGEKRYYPAVDALGGSATNDLGLGMLAALGWKFYNDTGAEMIPSGGTMGSIARFEKTAEFDAYERVSFSAMCDVSNPLLGAAGAAAVFAPQKGASPKDVALLEAGAAHFAALSGKDPARPGAGAAGGLGYACLHFLGGTLRRGIDEILRLYDFDALMQDCRLLITGEGCFDAQSAMGKAVGTLIRRAAPIPAVVFAGRVEPFDRGLYPNLKEVYAISEGQPLEQALTAAKENLRRCFDESQLPYPYI